MSRATNNILLIISLLICIQSALSLKLAKAKGQYFPQRSSVMWPIRPQDISPKPHLGKCQKSDNGKTMPGEKKHFEKKVYPREQERSFKSKQYSC